ncbi:helix-turn-helix transcriptional regulator [Lysinibacillus sp. FSL K6-1151]|uniref:helix-turn-helix transcriptional regulator n=1 Tax=Lysinibacillus sp. FSL K6-1151 TaxID=2921465 RepID=UPI00315ACDFB
MDTNKRDNLKSLRLANNWTQYDLAKRVGTSQQTICAWEQGIRSPTLKRAKKLAELFEVPIEFFL